MTPCPWVENARAFSPPADAVPANGVILLISNLLTEAWLVEEGVGVVRPDELWVVGGEQRVAAYRGARRAPVGVAFDGEERCIHTIEILQTVDTVAPAWTLSPRKTSDVPLAVQESQAFIWTAAISEPGFLVFWSAGNARPIRITTFPSLCCGNRFAFRIPRPEDEYRIGAPSPYQIFEALSYPGATVIRPMDNAGNLGDAWLVDPEAGTAARLSSQEAAIYRWPPTPASNDQPRP